MKRNRQRHKGSSKQRRSITISHKERSNCIGKLLNNSLKKNKNKRKPLAVWKMLLKWESLTLRSNWETSNIRKKNCHPKSKEYWQSMKIKLKKERSKLTIILPQSTKKTMNLRRLLLILRKKLKDLRVREPVTLVFLAPELNNLCSSGGTNAIILQENWSILRICCGYHLNNLKSS